MPTIPEEQRWNIVNTWKRMGQVLSATARELGLALKVVRHWVAAYESSGAVQPAPRSGRPRALSAAAAVRAHELILQEAMGGAAMVAKQLSEEGLTSATRDKKTIIRAVRRVGDELGRPLMACRGTPRKQLTPTNMELRVAFCKSNLNRDWSSVMITDRKKFLFKYPGTVVRPIQWLEKGQRRRAPQVNHPQGVSVYAGLTCYGVTSMHEVTGTSKLVTNYTTKAGCKSKGITQQEYKDVLTNTLLKEGQTIFRSHKVMAWDLQQDNDKAHNMASQVISSVNRQASTSISLIQDWPPNSPDLSPIENLWELVKGRVDARGCKTFSEFRAAVHEEWGKVTPGLAARYVSSIPGRLGECLQNEGAMTKH